MAAAALCAALLLACGLRQSRAVPLSDWHDGIAVRRRPDSGYALYLWLQGSRQPLNLSTCTDSGYVTEY